jgi:DNA ligase-1
MKTVYKLNSSGNIQEWSIWSDGHVIHMSYGVAGGVKKHNTEIIKEGLAGRTLEEQVALRIKSRLRRRYDLGYRDSIEEAMSTNGQNVLGLPAPMLAKKISDVRISSFDGSFIQRKYNGHRCLVTRVGDKLIAYSRNGRYISTIDHILENIDIPEGCTIDGELYAHGERLQTIASWVKRSQEQTKKLKYVVYDLVSNQPFADRFNQLLNYRLGPSSQIAQTYEYGGDDEIVTSFIDEGYEGAIIRLPNTGYEIGKRSSSLLKVKNKFDDEFTVVDILESKDGWAILVCALHDGSDTFRVAAPGTHEEKFEVFRNADYYIGRNVQVEYYDVTATGKPFHPVALQWRNKDEE